MNAQAAFWMRNGLVLLVLAISTSLGCGRSEPAKPAAVPVAQPAATPAPPPPPPAATANVPPPAPPAPAAPSPATVQTKATVGVGEKGRGYGGGVIMSPITGPVSSLFAAREMTVFSIQVPEAMKLFKATEDRLPKSHEEFMERIIKENHINLPQLPEGHRYVYDPKRGELMVAQPAPQK